MNSVLIQQQQQLAHAIRHNGVLPDDVLKPTPQGSAARLSVYTIAYRSRLGEALKENYPVLAKVVGDDLFADLANAYLDAYPSCTPSIRWFGAWLAEFAGQSDWLPHPSLLDLIRMEWALNTAFDAADAGAVTVADMLALQPDQWPALRFEMQPALRLLALQWNIEPLWSTLVADDNAEAEAPDELAHHLLIWRVGHKTQWRSVVPAETVLLMAAMAGQTFTQLCECAAESVGDDAARTVAGYVRIWVEAGMIAGIR